jgi:DNA-binding NarL/FixJ family response regulator
MIRLLVADDHALMREGVKQIVALSDDVVVTAEAGSGARVRELLREGAFDLMLLDLTMPDVSGVDLICWVQVKFPALPILVLSMHNEPAVVVRVLRAGATGYLTKDNDPQNLMAAIRKTAAGGQYIDPKLAEHIAFGGDTDSKTLRHQRLTDRELHILRLWSRGRSINNIAEELAISNKTVSTHKARLMEKMGIHSNAELVRYALAHGIVD